MQYVYLLKSTKTGSYYIGCTNDLRRRVAEHNSGKSISTKSKMPWELRYYEAYTSKSDAFQREKQLKKNKSGYRELRKRLVVSMQ